MNISKQLWLTVATIVLFSIPVLFCYLGGWSFLEPDEGRYGSIPQQMLTHADFVTPTQNEVKFFDKPPLLYWAIAASYSVFGYKEWAARLIPALAAFMGLSTAYGLGRRMFGPRAGIIGTVILSTSLMWPIMAHVVITDMLVSSLVFLALALWWMAHSENSGRASRRQTGYYIGFWTALAFAVLAKGPVTIVLVGATIFLYMLLCRQWQALPGMRWAIGVPLFLLITAPWFILVAQRNPEFNHFFWYDQHIGRFLGTTTGNDHVQGFGYYFKFLPLIFFPWSLFVPAALITGWGKLRHVTKAKHQAAVYLLCGVAFTLLFFSASSGKLLTYILPIVPLLALLLAAYFDWLYRQPMTWNRMLAAGVVVLTTILTVCGIAIIVVAPSKLSELGVNESAANTLGWLLVAWAIILASSSWRFRLSGIIAGTAGGFAVVLVALMALVSTIAPRFTTEPLVRYIGPGLTPNAEVLTMSYIRSIPFYVGRRVEILGTPDEMKMGVEQMPLPERRAWFFDGPAEMANLKEEMTDSYPVYCFIRIRKRDHDKVEALMQEIGNGAVPIASNERFLVFGNRAAVAMTPPQADLLH